MAAGKTQLNATRETIYAALYALVSAAVLADGTTPAFARRTRRMRGLDSIPIDDQPLLIFQQNGENASYGSVKTPTNWKFGVVLWIFFWNQILDEAATVTEPEVTPQTQVNNLVDAVESSLYQSADYLLNGRQTLGGLVHHVRIKGEVEVDYGYEDQQGIIKIPIEIEATN